VASTSPALELSTRTPRSAERSYHERRGSGRQITLTEILANLGNNIGNIIGTPHFEGTIDLDLTAGIDPPFDYLLSSNPTISISGLSLILL